MVGLLFRREAFGMFGLTNSRAGGPGLRGSLFLNIRAYAVYTLTPK